MKNARIVAITMFALATPMFAHAGTASDNMSVSATVSNTCTISAGALSFGSYDPVAGSQVDNTAALTVACTKGHTAGITLDQGSNADTGSTDDVPLRRMADGSGNYLAYFLYQDSGRTTVWGGTTSSDKDYTAADSSSSNITVYGRISASQDVPAGSFSDTVSSTITF